MQQGIIGGTHPVIELIAHIFQHMPNGLVIRYITGLIWVKDQVVE